MKRADRLFITVCVTIVVIAFGIILSNPIPESCKDSQGYVSEC